MLRKVSVIRKGDDFYIEYKSEKEYFISTKIRGGVEVAATNAHALIDAFINAGLSDGLDLSVGLREYL